MLLSGFFLIPTGNQASHFYICYACSYPISFIYHVQFPYINYFCLDYAYNIIDRLTNVEQPYNSY